jgi:hypothetical protein
MQREVSEMHMTITTADYVASDGELFFSRKGGFHAFLPKQILQQKNTRLPDIRITGFQMLGDQNPSAVFELWINRSGKLQLSDWHTTRIYLLFRLPVSIFMTHHPFSYSLCSKASTKHGVKIYVMGKLHLT